MTISAIDTGSPPASAERDGCTQVSVGGHSLDFGWFNPAYEQQRCCPYAHYIRIASYYTVRIVKIGL